jgi:hypothetical protein
MKRAAELSKNQQKSAKVDLEDAKSELEKAEARVIELRENAARQDAINGVLEVRSTALSFGTQMEKCVDMHHNWMEEFGTYYDTILSPSSPLRTEWPFFLSAQNLYEWVNGPEREKPLVVVPFYKRSAKIIFFVKIYGSWNQNYDGVTNKARMEVTVYRGANPHDPSHGWSLEKLCTEPNLSARSYKLPSAWLSEYCADAPNVLRKTKEQIMEEVGEHQLLALFLGPIDVFQGVATARCCLRAIATFVRHVAWEYYKPIIRAGNKLNRTEDESIAYMYAEAVFRLGIEPALHHFEWMTTQ